MQIKKNTETRKGLNVKNHHLSVSLPEWGCEILLISKRCYLYAVRQSHVLK